MSNIEKIRQEIDTRRQHMVEELMGHEENCEYHRIKGMHDAYVDLLTFLDYSLPEEKPSEDLEEAAEELFETIEIQEHENIFEDTFKKIFIAGAEWQNKQMMDEWLKDRDGCFWDGVNEGKKAMEEQMNPLTVEDIKTILDISFWNNDPQKILEEYNRLCDTSKVTRR